MANYDEIADSLYPDASGSAPALQPDQPNAPVSKYEAVADELYADQRSAVRSSFYNAQTIDPDQQAEALRLAQKRGLPTATVRDNLDQVRRQEEIEAVDFDALTRDNPSLAKWLSVPDNAAVARDSIAPLDAMRKVWTGYQDTLRSVGSGVIKPVGMTLSGAGTAIDTAARALDTGYRKVFGDAAADAVWVDGPWWLNPTEILRRPGEQIEGAAEAVAPPEERQNLLTDTASGVGQIGAQIAMMLATGGTVGTGMLFAQGADQQYDRAREAGASQEATDAAVMLGGAVTAVTERFGLDRLLDRVPPNIKNEVLRRLTDAAAAGGIEAVQEATEGAMQNLVSMALYDPNQPLFEGLEREALAAGGSGAVGRLILGAVIPGRQAARAQAAGEQFEQTDGAVDGVPLRERSPEKFQEVLQEQLKAQGRDQVYMPVEQWETLFQGQGIDPAEAYAEMTGGDASAYVEAAATRSDLRIPYAAYLAKLEPEVRKKLTPHLRLSPEDMTAFEAEQFDQNRQSIMDGVTEAVRAGVEAQQADPAYDTIYNDLLGQLLGRFPRDVAEKYATAEASRFIAFNRLAGTDPLQDYQTSGYKIRTEVPETLRSRSYEVELDPLLDRIRAGEIPSDEEIYGKSLVQFIADLGGIEDESMAGELRRLNESDRADRKGLPRLVRPGGVTLDEALRRATEAGYFTSSDPNAPEQYGINDLLDALDDGFTGSPRYSMSGRNDALEQTRRYMDDIQEFLGRSGVDLGAVDNEQVKRILRGELIPEEIEAPGEQIMDQGPGTAAFDAWFGDSKVVDAEGKPLVVYHGTRGNFDSFDPGRAGENMGMPDEEGVFFTSDPAEAAQYSEMQGRRSVSDGSNVMPVYLSLQNPLTLEKYTDMYYTSADIALGDNGLSPVDYFDDNRRNVLHEAKKAGHDGVLFTYNGQTLAVAFRPEQIKSAIGNRGTFDPNDPNILNQPQAKQPGNRGKITFNRPAGGPARDFNITLLEGADLSTFLHESGHYWLERLRAATGKPDAPQDLRDMMQTLLDHWGLQSADQITVKQHEDFARMNETYLMEGKAPSLRLRQVFARFRSWLLGVYKRLSALNVNLSPEVRQVFDRLYATQEEIDQAQQAQATGPMFRSQEEAGMTDAEWAAYLGNAETSRRQAEEDLANEVMEPIRREEKKWWRDERKKVRAEVTAEVNRRKDFVALSVLRTGKMPDGTPVPAAPKLSRKRLVSDFDMTPATLKTLPRGIYSAEGGESADALSGMFGYPNGKALVEALAVIPDKQQFIEQATDAEMQRRYPDVLETGTVGERAVRAVHNDKAGELMVREAQVLAAKAGAAAQGKAAGLRRHQISLQMAKAAADRVIEATQVRLLNPGKWKAAAGKAGNEAFRFAMEGKHAEALRAKERQILNHALYRAASQAVERADKARDYLAKLSSNKDRRSRIGHAGGWEYVVRDRTGAEQVYESRTAAEAAIEERGGFYFATNTYLDQIDRLLEQYELRPVTNRKLQRREDLRAFVDGLEKQGIPHSIPEEALRDAKATNYREVPYGLFMALRDAVKSIEQVALKKNELLVAGEKRLLDETATGISESIRQNAPGDAPAIGSASRTLAERAGEFGRDGLSLWLNPNYITREMDGHDAGELNRQVYRPVVAAEARRNLRKRLDTEAYAALMEKHYSKDELRAMNRITGKDAIPVPELGMTLNKWDVLAMAANWGNEGNRLALLEGRYADGRQLTQPVVERLLGLGGKPGVMTAKDWAFVQDTWDFINRYKDEVAAAHQRRTGERLDMVEGDPFEVTTQDGQRITLAGGYYPLKYDPKQGTTAQQDDAADFFDTLKQGRGSVTQTKRGHTIERKGSGSRPVRLDFKGVTFGHLNEVITNLEMGDEINAAWRLLQHGKVRSAFFSKGRKSYLEALDLWLKDVAVGEMPARSAMGKIFRGAKTNFTKALLTFKVATAVLQLTGYAQSISVIGPAAMYRGLRQFASRNFEGRRGVKEQIMAMSPFMRERWEGGQFNPAVADVMRAAEGKPAFWLQGGYWMMGQMQKLVDAPTWLGAYDASMREHGDPKRAVSDADNAIERAQVGGQFGQRSGFLRGSTGLNEQQSEGIKAFTALQSYMFAKGNIAYEQTRRTNFKNPKDVTKWAGRMVWLFSAEVMMLGILKEILGGGWDDEDEDGAVWDDAAKWIAKEAVLGVAGVLPLGGMLSSELQGFRGNLPVQEIFKTTGQAVTQIQQGEPDAAFWKSLSSTIGMLTGAPSGQANVAIDAYFKDQDGEDVSPLDYVIKTENR